MSRNIQGLCTTRVSAVTTYPPTCSEVMMND